MKREEIGDKGRCERRDEGETDHNDQPGLSGGEEMRMRGKKSGVVGEGQELPNKQAKPEEKERASTTTGHPTRLSH